jgi:hypothetical protein
VLGELLSAFRRILSASFFGVKQPVEKETSREVCLIDTNNVNMPYEGFGLLGQVRFVSGTLIVMLCCVVTFCRTVFVLYVAVFSQHVRTDIR